MREEEPGVTPRARLSAHGRSDAPRSARISRLLKVPCLARAARLWRSESKTIPQWAMMSENPKPCIIPKSRPRQGDRRRACPTRIVRVLCGNATSISSPPRTRGPTAIRTRAGFPLSREWPDLELRPTKRELPRPTRFRVSRGGKRQGKSALVRPPRQLPSPTAAFS
jgi:hypothetical protein